METKGGKGEKWWTVGSGLGIARVGGGEMEELVDEEWKGWWDEERVVGDQGKGRVEEEEEDSGERWI